MTRLFFVIVIFGLLAGCAAFEKADDVVMSGKAESAIFNIEYTPIEQQMIRHVISEYGRFHDEWKDFIQNPVDLDALGDEKLQEDYASLKDRYHELEHIVTVNFSRFDEVTKEQLLKYQGMANDVDRSMRIFMTVSDVATYGALVAKIASKML